MHAVQYRSGDPERNPQQRMDRAVSHLALADMVQQALSCGSVAFVGAVPGPPRAKAGARQQLVCSAAKPVITVLDYGAGNVRSLTNAVSALGFPLKFVHTAQDILDAEKLLFPGVGAFETAMDSLRRRDFDDALRQYLLADRPYLGICLGLQTLFDGSEESPGMAGLGVFPGTIERFDGKDAITAERVSVPHMGWNSLSTTRKCSLLNNKDSGSTLADDRFYFVHSFRKPIVDLDAEDFILATTEHGSVPFASIVQRGQVCATQFHPEKSGAAGLRLLQNFLEKGKITSEPGTFRPPQALRSGLAKRVVACLDVRENDDGDLVVTKGDQYDVREKSGGRAVRNLGKPVSLAHRYYQDGADEVTFLNITSFRGEPLKDTPMLEVLERTSEGVFVPLCIGGGIRGYKDQKGNEYSALDVAARYFRAGADKISLGSDAVVAAESFLARGEKTGESSIELISRVYGAQAVVVSVDPRRVWVASSQDTDHVTVKPRTGACGPDGEEYCWYQCTIKGGREGRDLDVVQLVRAVEELGAGEVLLNSMDADGSNQGYDLDLIVMVREAVSIPVIASSGAGKPEHFTTCFDETKVEAALAAGIFHRQEVSVDEVKQHMESHGTAVRRN